MVRESLHELRRPVAAPHAGSHTTADADPHVAAPHAESHTIANANPHTIADAIAFVVTDCITTALATALAGADDRALQLGTNAPRRPVLQPVRRRVLQLGG